MGDQFKYWAFITYSHHDRAWAEWLHKALERYRVPRHLVGRPSRDGQVPRRLLPIFRDRDELPGAADLGTALYEALQQSRYQIVICSPHAAKSKWVEEEVRYFKAQGRADRILCLIVDGEPNASDHPEQAALECFAPALRYRYVDGQRSDEREHLVAADARTQGDGRDMARLRLVAGLVHVGFDELRQRELRRRTLVTSIAVGASLSIAATTSLLAWSAYQARNEARTQTERVKLTKAYFVSIFANSDPMRRKDGAPATLGEALDDAIARVDTDLADDPRLQGDLLDDLGEIKAGQGDLPGAKAMFQRALPLHEKTLAPNDPAIANTLVNLGTIESYMGHTLDGGPYLKRAVDILEKHADTEGDALNNARSGLAGVYRASGDLPAAMEQMKLSLAFYRKDPGPAERRLGILLGNMGGLSLESGDHRGAQTYYSECIEVIERNLGAQSASLSDCLYGLARNYAETHDSVLQVTYAERLEKIVEASFPVDHPWRARSSYALGTARLRQQRLTDGVNLLEQALAILARRNSNTDLQVAITAELAQSHLSQHVNDQALAMSAKGLSICETLADPHNKSCKRLETIRSQALAAVAARTPTER